MRSANRPLVLLALLGGFVAAAAAASSCATATDPAGGAGGATVSSGSKSSSGTKASSTNQASSTDAVSSSADATSTDASSSADATSTDAASSSASATSTTATSSSAASTTGATTSASSSSSAASSSASSSSSTGGGTNCVEITAANFWAVVGDGDAALYRAVASPNVNGSNADLVNFEFYGPAFGAYDGQLSGTFDLASGGDANYATCSRCLRVATDALAASGAKQFFQQSGTLTLPAGSNHIAGVINATLTDVTLVEVTIAPSPSFVSTPVPNGQCLHIASATVSATLPASAPPGWSCSAGFFLDGDCDCGCGVFDPDCVTPEVGACLYCSDTGSCSTTACPGTINATNNAICP